MPQAADILVSYQEEMERMYPKGVGYFQLFMGLEEGKTLCLTWKQGIQ